MTRISLTSALALSGDLQAARRERDALSKFAPFLTVRGYANREKGRATISDGLRLAGVRDHVDEDADEGVPNTAELHGEVAGLTPTSVIGAETIRTVELSALLAREHPLVIDINPTGRTLPGAILLHISHADTLDDAKQDRLRSKIAQLSGGDTSLLIVAVGWNAEHWGSRNLVLRLAAMGYTRVFWYRGGKEVWEARGMPLVEAESSDW